MEDGGSRRERRATVITLYRGSGDPSYSAEGPVLKEEDWDKRRAVAVALLTKRGNTLAAKLLETCGFSICQGANGWHDEFLVLFRTVGLDDYVEFEGYSRSPEHRRAFEDIAKTLTELGLFIRFVGVELVTELSPQPVTTPSPKAMSVAVEKALVDAEQMVRQGSPVSAVDRAHTALHGYLRGVCIDAHLAAAGDDLSLTDLVKRVREKHPKFSGVAAAHGSHTEKILKAMGVICDALNPIRNRGSLAHPNEELLDEADAMLAINASRTVLHYVHQKLES